MSISIQEALQQLDSLTSNGRVATPNELRSLAMQVSVRHEGAITIFYGGVLPDGTPTSNIVNGINDENLRILNKTDAGEFLLNDDFRAAVRDAFGLENAVLIDHPPSDNPNAIAANRFLDSADGLWGDASERFALETTGEVRILSTNPDKTRILYAREVPALLERLRSSDAITSIDGISRSELLKVAGDYGVGWTETMRNVVLDTAITNTYFAKPQVGNYQSWISLTGEGLGDLIRNATAIETRAWQDLLGNFEPPRAATRALSKLGLIGGVVGLGLVALQAATAETRGDHEGAKNVLKEFGLDVLGSTAGQVLATVAGGLAFTGLAAVGVIGAPVAGALTLVAGILGGIFGGDAIKEAYELTKDLDENGRADYIDRLTNLLFGADASITAALPPDLNGERLTLDLSLSREDIIGNAESSLAWRYAVRQLNPFVIPDVSYDAYNRNGELEFQDPVTGDGLLTEAYLEDRAQMLVWKIRYDIGARDDDDGMHAGPKPYDSDWDTRLIEGDWNYQDLATTVPGGGPLTLAIDGIGGGSAVHRIVFGSEANESLSGAVAEDRLYGMAGNDTLSGAEGADHLEGGPGDDRLDGGADRDTLMGGAGNDELRGGDGEHADVLVGGVGDDRLDGGAGADSLDAGAGDDTLEAAGDQASDILNGGAGNDIYRLSGAFGADRIIDPDGLGSLFIDEAAVSGSFMQRTDAPGLYEDPSGRFLAIRSGTAGLLLWRAGGGANSVFVENWTEGDLGISLGVAPQPPAPAPGALLGDREKLTDVFRSALLDEIGNPLGDWTGAHYRGSETGYELGEAQADAPDVLFGQAANDTILGLGGNDGLWGHDGEDSLDGGAGDDLIFGGQGADTLTGGEGRDYLFGSHGRAWQLIRYRDRVEPDGAWSFSDGGRWPAPWVADETLPGSRGFSWSVVPREEDGDLIVHAWGVSQAEAGDDAGDLLCGEAGDDVLVGGDGVDTLLGGADGDSLFGLGGADFLSGDGGDDYLDGDGPAAEGFERIWSPEVVRADGTLLSPLIRYTTTDGAKHGRDTLSGGSGADTLLGRGGDDLLLGGGGRDALFGDDRYSNEQAAPTAIGRDTLHGEAGDDLLFGGYGDDLLSGGADADWIFGDFNDAEHAELHGNDSIDGGDGNDSVRGGYGADFIRGGEGDDDLAGALADSGSGGGAEDGGDSIEGGGGNDQILGEGGDDSLSGGAGADSIWGGLGDDRISGDPGNDSLYGEDGHDRLDGGSGDDELRGGAGNDTLIGGPGRDFLQGGAGDDAYLVGLGEMSALRQGDGSLLGDTIDDREGANSLVLTGVTALEALRSYTYGTDLGITHGEGQALYFMGGNAGGLMAVSVGGRAYSIHEFRNRTLDERVEISASAAGETLSGGRLNDVLAAVAGNSTLMGGRGDDAISAGNGGNTVRFEQGDGQDLFSGGGGAAAATNVVVFGEGISPADLGFVMRSGSLVLEVGESDSMTFAGVALASLEANPPVGRFVFADRSELSWAELVARGIRVEGGPGHEELHGAGGNDSFRGAGGNDRVDGRGGSDLFRLQRGDGEDTISTAACQAGDLLSFQFGPDISPQALRIGWGRTGTELVLRYWEHESWWYDSVTIEDYFARVESGVAHRFAFADGTVWDDQFVALRLRSGGDGDDSLLGGEGADSLSGGAGADLLVGNGGNDTLDGGEGNDLLNAGDGDDLLIGGLGDDTLWGQGGNDLARGGEGDDSLSGLAGNDTLLGGAGSDTLDGGEGEDWLDGGAGAGSYEGGAGNDTLVLRAGMSTVYANSRWIPDFGVDQIYLDGPVTMEDLALTWTDDVATIGIQGDEAQLVLFNARPASSSATIGMLRFADGSAVTWSEFVRIKSPQVLLGGSAGELLQAGAGHLQVRAEDGDDTLIGNGNASLFGGAGDDLVDPGRRWPDDAPRPQTGAGAVVTISGGAGSDTFLIDPQAATILIDSDPDPLSIDRATITRPVDRSRLSFSRQWEDLVIHFPGGPNGGGYGQPRLEIRGFFADGGKGRTLDVLEFADGVAWDWAELWARAVANPADRRNWQGTSWSESIIGSAGDDSVRAEEGDDTVFGSAGFDTLSGGAGNDLLEGGAGNDMLRGDSGADTLVGGPGDDLLLGAAGDDRYRFDAGHGRDAIRDADGVNTLELGAGLVAEAVEVFRERPRDPSMRESLVLHFASTGDEIVIEGIPGDASNRLSIDRVIFDAGAGPSWDLAELAARMAPSAAVDAFLGGPGDDFFAVDSRSDGIVEAAAGGHDRVEASVGYRLPDHLEELVLLGARPLDGTGNSSSNLIVGNQAANLLSGDARSGLGTPFQLDTLVGGAGDDIYWLSGGGQRVSIVEQPGGGNDWVWIADLSASSYSSPTEPGGFSYTLPDGVENLRLGYSLSLSRGDQVLYRQARGNAADNVLIAGVGAPTRLDGLGGADTLVGGGGDLFVVDSADDVVISTGLGTVESAVDFVLPEGVHGLSLVGGRALRGTGNRDDNTLDGASNPAADRLAGLGGDDRYLIGPEDEVVEAPGEGEDTVLIVLGASGEFRLSMYDNVEHLELGDALGASSLVGSAGANRLVGNALDNRLVGGEGQDSLRGGGGADLLEGDDGDDLLEDGGGGNWLRGGAGNDWIRLRGAPGASPDTLEGGAGDDLYLLDELGPQFILEAADGGTDWIRADGFIDRYVLPEHVENLSGGAREIVGNAAANRITGDRWDTDDWSGPDNLLRGLGGNDVLLGLGGNDTLDGGAGNDLLIGGMGADTYLFGRGGGRDTISNHDTDARGANPDRLLLATDIGTADLRLARAGDDLRIRLAGSDDAIDIAGFLRHQGETRHALDWIEFGDGTRWSATQVAGMVGADDAWPYLAHPIPDLQAGNGLRFAYSFAQDVFVSSDPGGSLAYRATLADGSALPGWLAFDAVTRTFSGTPGAGDAGTLSILLTATEPSGRSASDTFDLTIAAANAAPVLDLPLADQAAVGSSPFRFVVPSATFADPDPGDTLAFSVRLADGSPLPAWLTFDSATRTFSGTPTNEDAGTLTIALTATDSGGLSASATFALNVVREPAPPPAVALLDRFVVAGTVFEIGLPFDLAGSALVMADASAVPDWLRFDAAAARLHGVTPAGLQASFELVLRAGDDPGIVPRALALIVTDELAGDGFANQLVGSALPDGLAGAVGDDSLYGRAGQDRLDGGEGVDRLYGGADGDLLLGGPEGDYLYGGSGDDTLEGGSGDDSVNGGAGSDVYLFALGDGQDVLQSSIDLTPGKLDVLRFSAGIAADELRLSTTGGTLVISIVGADDRILVRNFLREDDPGNPYSPLQQIRFADGSTWTQPEILARLHAGSDAAEMIGGTFAADTLSGLAGDDSLYGRAGADLLDGGPGADRLYGGDDGDALLGGADDDALYGEAGDDTLDGAAGNDRLSGGTGSDTYRFGRGDGQDSVYATSDPTPGKLDTLEFKPGVAADEITLATSGSALVVGIAGTAERLTVRDFLRVDDPANPYNPLQQMRFADGTQWSLDEILARLHAGSEESARVAGTLAADTIAGLGGNDTLQGRGGADELDGGPGTDRLYGGSGNDLLLGGEGSDYLYGEEGDDTLAGGAGNDYLAGALGADTYRFGRGDGADRLFDLDADLASADVLAFGAGVSPEQLWFRRVGTALEVAIVGAADKLTVNSWYAGDEYRIERFTTSDGASLLGREVEALVSAMAGFAPPPAGQTELPADYRQSLQPVIAAAWTPAP